MTNGMTTKGRSLLWNVVARCLYTAIKIYTLNIYLFMMPIIDESSLLRLQRNAFV